MQSISNRITRHGLAFTAALALAAAPAFGAASDTWQGDDGTNPTLWTVGANWASGSVPGASASGDWLEFPNGASSYVVDLNGDKSTSTLYFNNTTGNNYSLSGGNLTITPTYQSGLFRVNSTGNVTYTGNVTWSGDQNVYVINSAAKLTTIGNFTANNAATDDILLRNNGTWEHFGNLTALKLGYQSGSGTYIAHGLVTVSTLAPSNGLATFELASTGTLAVGQIAPTSAGLHFKSDTDRAFSTANVGEVRFGNSAATYVLNFTGDGDLTFAAPWHANTTTAKIASIGVKAGATVTVNGNFTQSSGAITGLDLQDGGTFVIGSNSIYGWAGSNVNITEDTTLLVNGTMTADTATIAVTDGTLGGTGTINRNVNVAAGGKLAPGQSPGTLNITGVVDLASGFTLDWEYGEFLKDLVNITGTLDLTDANTSASTVNLIDAGGTLQSGDILFATTGGITGVLDGTVLNWTILGGEGVTAVVDGNNVVLSTLIPEPASLLLALAGGLLIVPFRGRGHRRQRSVVVA